METVSMHQAKSSLSRLVKSAANGETILIGAYGKPTAKLVASDLPTRPAKKIGVLAGKLKIPDDFDAPLPTDVLADFEGQDQ